MTTRRCWSIGPAVIDIAEFIGKCHLGATQPNEALVQAVVDGYSHYRDLHPDEIECLPDAMRFRPLMLLGGFLTQRIDGTLDVDDLLYGRSLRDWQAYLALTDDIATVAAGCFRNTDSRSAR